MDTAQRAETLMVVVPFVIAVVFAPIFFFQRMRHRRTQRGFAPSYGSLGNALQTMQMLTRPTIHFVLEEKLSEATEEVADGAPSDPVDSQGSGRPRQTEVSPRLCRNGPA